MIDHIGLRTRDFEKAKAFYTQALAPLGYVLLRDIDVEGYRGAGFGVGQKPDFWIGLGEPSGPAHVAIAASDRAAVDAFHRAALAAGAKDNGAPGPRPQYHPGYYGAFVIDPDGHNLEAVCHRPG
jgi:catechol 2,3-dioxygenase-like lactoylglutathione lyase family enzyme